MLFIKNFGPATGASVGPVPTPLKASEKGYLVDSRRSGPLGSRCVPLCACVPSARVRFTDGGREALTLPI